MGNLMELPRCPRCGNTKRNIKVWRCSNCGAVTCQGCHSKVSPFSLRFVMFSICCPECGSVRLRPVGRIGMDGPPPRLRGRAP